MTDGKANEPGGGDQQWLGSAPSELDQGEQGDRGDQDGGQVDDGAATQHDDRPAMAPIAPAVTPSTNAATAGCLPWRRNHGAGMMVSR